MSIGAGRVLSAAFKSQMKKPTQRTRVNMGRMTDAQIRAEYTKQAKVANKRIAAIQKSGYYSPAVEHLSKKGIMRFGLKNQNLTTAADIRRAYHDLMDFMSSTTSTRTGIRDTIDKMSKNFGLKFNGNYSEFSKKAKKVFDLYEDLYSMSQKGELQSGDKYDIVNDLGTLYDEGIIDEDTTASELVDILTQMANDRKQYYRDRQSQLKFNWQV